MHPQSHHSLRTLMHGSLFFVDGMTRTDVALAPFSSPA